MDCVYSGDFRFLHYKKRRMMGPEKKRAINSMVNEHTDPSVYIRNKAKTLMREGKFFK